MKIIPIEEYEAMWETFKDNRRVTADMFPDRIWIGQTCSGHSGEGTPFKDEYDRMMDEVNNPKIPRCVRMWTQEGLIHYYPDTPFNRKMKEDQGDAE